MEIRKCDERTDGRNFIMVEESSSRVFKHVVHWCSLSLCYQNSTASGLLAKQEGVGPLSEGNSGVIITKQFSLLIKLCDSTMSALNTEYF